MSKVKKPEAEEKLPDPVTVKLPKVRKDTKENEEKLKRYIQRGK